MVESQTPHLWFPDDFLIFFSKNNIHHTKRSSSKVFSDDSGFLFGKFSRFLFGCKDGPDIRRGEYLPIQHLRRFVDCFMKGWIGEVASRRGLFKFKSYDTRGEVVSFSMAPSILDDFMHIPQ